MTEEYYQGKACECSQEDACRFVRERDEALKVLRHCKMFIVDRKGYHDNEEDEIKSLKEQITKVLNEEKGEVWEVMPCFSSLFRENQSCREDKNEDYLLFLQKAIPFLPEQITDHEGNLCLLKKEALKLLETNKQDDRRRTYYESP